MEPQLRGRALIEVIGKPKEHVVETIDIMLKTLSENTEVKLTDIDRSEPEQIEDSTLISAFFECGVEFRNFDALYGFILDTMPTSVEIEDPVQFDLDLGALNGMIAEFIGKINQYDRVVKEKIAENVTLKRQIDNLVRNLMIISTGKDSLTVEEISVRSGINPAVIEQFITLMVRDGVLVQLGGRFKVANNANGKR